MSWRQKVSKIIYNLKVCMTVFNKIYFERVKNKLGLLIFMGRVTSLCIFYKNVVHVKCSIIKTVMQCNAKCIQDFLYEDVDSDKRSP